MDLRAEHNSRNVSISVTPSFPASKSTNGPSRRPEKNIVRKVSGSKARVHGRRNPVQLDLTAQKYEHKRGRVGARDKVKLEWRRDELDTSKVTGGEATQRGGVPLETSFGPHQALQYQTYLNTYRTSRDVRTTSVTQGSPPPPVNFSFAHYDSDPSRPAYKSQQQCNHSLAQLSAALASSLKQVQREIEENEKNGRPARESVSHRESMDSSSISQQRVSSESRPISPWTVPPTTIKKAQEVMHGIYKKERQKADRSRSNHNKSNKKRPFVLKYTLLMDDTKNEVSRNRTQFVALESDSQ
ncbi:hypothetical protein HBH51_094700 [Parastagonospora nodorum]|nr:hypothetical protein HBH51_094700 [Parastagonospora nodorum]